MLERARQHAKAQHREAQRRYRVRRRRAVTVVQLELTPERHQKLARLGYLRGELVDTRAAGMAIGKLIDDIEL
jgi:hypothetical protein